MNQLKNTIFYRMYLLKSDYFVNQHMIKNYRFYNEKFKKNNIDGNFNGNINGNFNYRKLVYDNKYDNKYKDVYTIISKIMINDVENDIQYKEYYEFTNFGYTYIESHELGKIFKNNDYDFVYNPLLFNQLPPHIKKFIYMKNDKDNI